MRSGLGVGLGVGLGGLLASVLAVAPMTRGTAHAQGTAHPYRAARAEPVTGPPTVSADDLRFVPRSLRQGSAGAAGLLPDHVAAIRRDVMRYLEPSPQTPLYPGAVVLAARAGVIVTHQAMGDAVRYADDAPTELPPSERVPMRRDTIFDMASVTKLFTAVVTVQQIERGRISLDAPVASYIPEFAAEGKGAVTVRQLLTHTSGLPAWLPLYRDWPTVDARYQAVFAVKPTAAAGVGYTYSDLNLIVLGKIVEKVTGRRLDQVVAADVTGPLGMTDTDFNPPASKLDRIAATEWQPSTGRGMVRGSVHDENAWSLNGVAGHAGIFSTADDLAILAQTVLNGGRYGRTRILSEESVRAMLTDFNPAFPSNAHGLGFELAQRWYMDAMSSPVAAGHTGFTGTSLVIDPLSRSLAILLTNRVHPSRAWGSINPARRAVARDLGRAVPVRPAEGRSAWFSGLADAATVTLAVTPPAPAARVSFDLWYDTEPTDVGSLEVSPDGRQWTAVPLSLRSGRHEWSSDGRFAGFAGRRWASVSAALPPGTTTLRWRYTADALYQGRGVYVDGVRTWNAAGELGWNGERDAGRFQPDGWVLSRD